jgi:hypothetical protein
MRSLVPSVALASLCLALGACPSSPPAAPPPPGLAPGTAVWPAPAPPVPQGPAPAPAPGGTQITIGPGGGGGIAIQGAPALHGDPAACAAYQACCAPHQGQLSPAGLACGLVPAAANGDCGQSLQQIRAVFGEQHIALPAGCAP